MFQWIERLKTEARQQKGKACILGGIFVVALAMWAPILASYWSDEKKQMVSESTAAAAKSVSLRHQSTCHSDWEQQLASRQRNSRQPYRTMEGKLRDPFLAIPNTKKTESTEPEPPPAPAPVVTPQQAGLRLESTLRIGSVRAARINNELQRQGDEITDKGQPTGFWLTDVARGHIVVQRDGHFHRMELPQHQNERLNIQVVKPVRQ